MELVIAIISLLASLGAVLYDWYLHRRQRKLEVKLAEQQVQINKNTLEHQEYLKEQEKKAMMFAQTFKSGDEWRLQISNEGKGTAYNIRIEELEQIEDEYGLRIYAQGNLYPQLDSGQSYTLKILSLEGCVQTVLMELSWDDEFQKNNKRLVAVNVAECYL